MKCGFSRETLALFVEGDLSADKERTAAQHVMKCAECSEFLDQLRQRQSMVKSIRHDGLPPAAYENLRREVMTKIRRSPEALGWMLRLERALIIGFGRRTYALAGLAILAIISATLLAQIRNPQAVTPTRIAAFEDRGVLVRPEGYRGWVFAGSTSALCAMGQPSNRIPSESLDNVYVDPDSYREYTRTGTFPEGTVIVLERTQGEGGQVTLAASVKDSSRFVRGWGFFDFTDAGGGIRDKASEASDDRGCRSCHEQRGATDHVFTQFYPALRLLSSTFMGVSRRA